MEERRAGSTGCATFAGQPQKLTNITTAIRTLTTKTPPLQSLEGFPVTDKPASESTARKRPPKDKWQNKNGGKRRKRQTV
ncbi:hypothetical protein OK016_16085 [Vibrio chagasii]|nr:hypothetical protein [Vibrio chagasii]